ncbi:hypothetical protein TGRUB_464956 [Toxoplasma gondii RUB]|uniref:Guanylate-binding protein n=2 Tax=Toxoplasma gondii TaxID=5811 RepID=A0A086MA64_TOXGO|nr:hypothetical protein TGRUB_464956 [Toxoplasma gondii RUB]
MSPACFAAGDLASTSLSGVEPKAQKPIRSGSKNFSDPSRRLRNPLEKTEAPWGVSLTPPAREADATTLEARANLQNQAAKPDTLSSDEDLNLVATAPSSRKVSTHRTGLDMARNGYRTVDPWASYDARQDENGAKSAIFSGLAASAAAQNEPQKTWGAKGQAANPAQAVTRLVGEKDTGESEYPYTAKGSNDSCSTATSNYHEAARSGGPTWGRLALSDGIRYASAYLGKSFSGTGRDAIRGDSQALYASATSVGDVFFRPTVSANGAAPAAVPAQPYTSYIFDPMTHNGTSAYSKIYSQTDQTGLLRSAEDVELINSKAVPVPVPAVSVSQDLLATKDGVSRSGSFYPLQTASLSLPSEFRRGGQAAGPATGSLDQGAVLRIPSTSSTSLAHSSSSEVFQSQQGLLRTAPQTLLSNESVPLGVRTVGSGSFVSSEPVPFHMQPHSQPFAGFFPSSTGPPLPFASKISYTPAPLQVYRQRRESVGEAVQRASLLPAEGPKQVSLTDTRNSSHTWLAPCELSKTQARRLSLPTGAARASCERGSDAQRVFPSWATYTSVSGVLGEQHSMSIPQVLETRHPARQSQVIYGLAEGAAPHQPGPTPAYGFGIAPSRGVCTPPLVPSVPLYSCSKGEAAVASSALRSASAYSAEDRKRFGRGAFSPASARAGENPEASPPTKVENLLPQSVEGDLQPRDPCRRAAKSSGASSPWSVAATCNSSRSSRYWGSSRKGDGASPASSRASFHVSPLSGGVRELSRDRCSEARDTESLFGTEERERSVDAVGRTQRAETRGASSASIRVKRGEGSAPHLRSRSLEARRMPGAAEKITRDATSVWKSREGPNKDLLRGRGASQGFQSLFDDAVAAIGAFFGQEDTEEKAGKRRDEEDRDSSMKPRREDKRGQEQDGNAASPLGTTRPGAPVYPVTLGYTAATSGYGQAVGSTQGLPAFPVAPLEPMYLSCNSVDYRPAVKLSPVRNVTSGVSPAAPAPVSWHAVSSLLASAPSPPVCPPVSGAPGVPPPSQPTRDTPPAAVHSTEASASPPPSPAERQQDDLDKKVRRNLRTVSDGLGDSSCRALSPAGSPSTQSRLHLFCGVVARPMKPAGGLGASPRDRGAHRASLQASFQTGERNAVGLTSLLLEKTAKPANRTRLLSKPLQLVHVNRWDGREVLTIDEQAKKFLSELGTQHVAVISICGVTQTGKSSFANLLLDDSHMLSAGGFPVGSPALCGDRGAFRSVSPCNSFAVGDRRAPEGLGAETGDDEDEFRGEAGKKFTQRILSDGCTEGVWIQAVCGGSSEAGADGREDLVYLILDFEGVGCTRKTVEHDQRLFTLAMLVSHYLIYTTRGVLDADAVSGLASVSLWTQRLLQGGGDRGPAREASPLDTSRTSPTREGASPTAGPSVPSGWRAPPLLWILQDFNFTLCDEDGYPLTETDYLEGIMATASHPASCCSPFSTFPASSTALSRTCAELNLPHVRMLRQQLETLFGDRTCVGLPHPLGDFGPDFGDSVGCEVPSQGSKSAREGASVGAFLATPRQSAAFASSFPCLGNRARTAEGVGESRSPGTRQGDAQSAFSASSPPPTQGRSRGRDGPALETVPVSEFQPIFRRRMQQTKNLVFKECRLKVAQSVAITGPGFVKILQRMIDGINGGQVPESGSVVVVVQREECRKWKEKCEEVFVNDLREAFQSRLPLASRELQEGALALQKKALALFKMHVIGDDDVVRGYKQQLKDRLRKITDRAMDENERHGEWKARSRLRALRERLRIDEKLNERLYESMTEVNEDAERLKREFNADIRGPSHVYQRVINDQIDELLAKGSEIVCGALLDQSRLAEKTVHELQQRAQDAEMSLEKALELEQQLQHRDYEAEELRRALQEERAANRGQATLRSGEFDCDEDFDDPYRRRGSFYRRSGRSRFATGDQSKCFRQRKCTIM